jgi:hypothetical protein
LPTGEGALSFLAPPRHDQARTKVCRFPPQGRLTRAGYFLFYPLLASAIGFPYGSGRLQRDSRRAPPFNALELDMPRNILKSFPTARLRRGFAHVHPLCAASPTSRIEPDDPRPPRADDSLPPAPSAPVAAPRDDEPVVLVA